MTTRPTTTAKTYLALDDKGLIAQCDVDCYRASGPGGQKRNKTSSAVRLRHRPTALAALANEDRSQHVNKARALRRLRLVIAMGLRTDLDLAGYEPGELLSTSISSAGTLNMGRKDERYPAAISELLDLLAATDARVSDTADRLGVTTANLIKFLQKDPKLWKHVNQMRTAAGRKPLR